MDNKSDHCKDGDLELREYELQKTVTRLKTQKTNSQNFIIQRKLTNISPKKV